MIQIKIVFSLYKFGFISIHYLVITFNLHFVCIDSRKTHSLHGFMTEHCQNIHKTTVFFVQITQSYQLIHVTNKTRVVIYAVHVASGIFVCTIRTHVVQNSVIGEDQIEHARHNEIAKLALSTTFVIELDHLHGQFEIVMVAFESIQTGTETFFQNLNKKLRQSRHHLVVGGELANIVSYT